MAVAKIWRNRLIADPPTQTFDNCPAKYQDMVLSLLRDDVANGVITSEKFEEITHQPY